MTMTPQQFIAKWGPGGPAFDLNERQGAQPHFMDLCALLGVPTPGSAGDYIFEQDTLVLGEDHPLMPDEAAPGISGRPSPESVGLAL